MTKSLALAVLAAGTLFAAPSFAQTVGSCPSAGETIQEVRSRPAIRPGPKSWCHSETPCPRPAASARFQASVRRLA